MLKKTSLLAMMISTVLITACNDKSEPAASATGAAAPSAGVTASADAQAPANALVKVNDVYVTPEMFASYYSIRRRAAGQQGEDSPQQQMAALEELVQLILLSQDAERQQLQTTPAVQAQLDMARIKIMAEAAIARILQESKPSAEAVQQRYDELVAKMPAVEYKARHILLETEDDAKAVIAELDKGADFATLAKEKSKGPSAPEGGELGWFPPDQMVKPFSEATATLEKGKYTETPVQTQFGWHVILLEDSRETKAPALEEIRDQLTSQIANQMRRQAMTDYIVALRDKSDIKVLGEQAEEAAGGTDEGAGGDAAEAAETSGEGGNNQ